jgi:hypothetical protein
MKSRTFGICVGVAACVTGCLIWITESRREGLRAHCLTRFANVNKALVLYRSDFDGYSPVYSRRDFLAADTKLTSYAKGTSLNCPLGEFRPSNMRFVSPIGVSTFSPTGFGVFTTFGVEDTSAVAYCIQHLRFPPKITFLNSGPDIRNPSGGTFTVLLRNGTSKSLAFNTPMQAWIIRNKEFRDPRTRPNSWTSYAHASTFKFEPAPPRFER